MRGMLAGLAAVAASVPAQALANPLKSRLTPIDLSQCTASARREGGRAWLCPGLDGYPVHVATDERRYMLSFGSDAERRRSARQSPGAVNTIFDGRRRPTVEWRVERLGQGREAPFATIVRFHAKAGDTEREILVITKVDAAVSCHIALIDASSTAEAMALARAWADRNVRARSCPDRPEDLTRAKRVRQQREDTPAPFKD